jgi:hypothetical protein
VGEEEFFVLYAFEEFAAEVGAAMAITRGRAARLIRIAEALHDRLPSVAASGWSPACSGPTVRRSR